MINLVAKLEIDTFPKQQLLFFSENYFAVLSKFLKENEVLRVCYVCALV